MIAATKMLDAIWNNKAFKLVDVGDLDEGILNVEKLDRFVRVVAESSPILNEARYQPMKSFQKNIDRIEMNDGILEPGRDADGNKRSVSNDAEVEVKTNTLVAKELIARLRLDYDTLEDNLEQAAFENTTIDLFGAAASRDIEKTFLYMDSAITWSTSRVSKIMSIGNGWLKKAGNQIYGLESTTGADDADFNPTDSDGDYDPIAIFKALMKATPNKYLSDRTNYRFYVPADVEDMYRDILAARGTVLGDNAITGNAPVVYKNIPIVSVPAFDDTTFTTVSKIPALLSKPSNMPWGLWRQVTIENQKDIDNRQIKNVLSMRGDCTYENEEAATVAWLNKAKPT
ncbi:MAG: hypothetical protein AMQ22_00081 [Candidatus Methanofastidiosum methylothiophilum]|uniref:Phage capsid family protein n=1 Tax=Candidatus Methanofastidiosum methylothiophilum TaxID=1705564 RepID=A0A150J9J8_9EURY|nr:MAG: hypothetical protein AMQ22_00081 [Candidatus Methanofastidiosum methylthiophilus]